MKNLYNFVLSITHNSYELFSQNGEQSAHARELLEQLELERKEKAEQIAKVRLLQEKILVSSQPAKPSKKSLLM